MPPHKNVLAKWHHGFAKRQKTLPPECATWPKGFRRTYGSQASSAASSAASTRSSSPVRDSEPAAKRQKSEWLGSGRSTQPAPRQWKDSDVPPGLSTVEPSSSQPEPSSDAGLKRKREDDELDAPDAPSAPDASPSQPPSQPRPSQPPSDTLADQPVAEDEGRASLKRKRTAEDDREGKSGEKAPPLSQPKLEEQMPPSSQGRTSKTMPSQKRADEDEEEQEGRSGDVPSSQERTSDKMPSQRRADEDESSPPPAKKQRTDEEGPEEGVGEEKKGEEVEAAGEEGPGKVEQGAASKTAEEAPPRPNKRRREDDEEACDAKHEAEESREVPPSAKKPRMDVDDSELYGPQSLLEDIVKWGAPAAGTLRKSRGSPMWNRSLALLWWQRAALRPL